jgi:hypothetical protein
MTLKLNQLPILLRIYQVYLSLLQVLLNLNLFRYLAAISDNKSNRLMIDPIVTGRWKIGLRFMKTILLLNLNLNRRSN